MPSMWILNYLVGINMPLPYYTQPKLHAAEAIYKKIVRILFPNVSILFNSYS